MNSRLSQSFADAGKRYRMGRIFGKDGRCLVLPLDHGTISGRVSGLEDPLAALRTFLAAPCDGFVLGPGLTRRSAELFAGRDAPARILTLDLYWTDPDGAGHRLGSDVETAVALGVDAVKLLMPWDVSASDRSHTAELISSVIAEADASGLPVMVEPVAFTTGPGRQAVEVASHGCRVAVELGADIIKIADPGDPELVSAWCEEAGVPLVLLGGAGSATPEEIVRGVKEAVAAGVSGAAIGRKVWQRPVNEALDLLAELSFVVHGRADQPAREPSEHSLSR